MQKVESICNRPDCCGATVFTVEGNIAECWDCLNIIIAFGYAMTFNPLMLMSDMDRMIYGLTGSLTMAIRR